MIPNTSVGRVGWQTAEILKQYARFFARFNGINLPLETPPNTEFREINLCDTITSFETGAMSDS